MDLRPGVRAAMPMWIGAITLAACRAPATPTPAPTPTLDTAALAADLREFLLREDASGTIAVTGTMKIGSVAIPMSGTSKFSGSDSETTMIVTGGGRRIEERQIILDGRQFTSTDGGPWLDHGSTAEARKAQLAMLVEAVDKLEYRGVVTGTAIPGLGIAVTDTLHHFAPDGAVPLPHEALGLDEETVRGMGVLRATMDFYATDDAQLAKLDMAVLWKQQAQDDLLDASLDYTMVTQAYKPVTILRPNEVWRLHTSDALDYKIGVPLGWSLSSTSGDGTTEMYENSVADRVMVWRLEHEEGAALKDVAQEFAAVVGDDLGVRAQDGDPVVVGGQPGLMVWFEVPGDDGPHVVVGAITQAGPVSYIVTRSASDFTADEAKRHFGRLLGTFSLVAPDDDGKAGTTG